jgi:hypothetical protein
MLIRPPDPTPAELADLAVMVRRLRPDWRDAEDFYELRSEITGALMRLARRLNGKALPAPVRVAAMPLRVVPPRPRPAPLPMPVVTAPRPPRRRSPVHWHRYPRPPRLPPTVQPNLL